MYVCMIGAEWTGLVTRACWADVGRYITTDFNRIANCITLPWGSQHL